MWEWLQTWMVSENFWWDILSWTMSAIALLGTLMNAERNKWGFIFWLGSNLYMTITFWVNGLFAQSVLFFVYFLLAVRGLFSWSKKEKQDEQQAQKAETV